VSPQAHNLEQVDFRAAIQGDPVLADLAALAVRQSVRILLVGGAVRDRLLGRPARDHDFILQAPPATGEAFLERWAAARQGRLLRFDKRGIRERRVVVAGRTLDFVLTDPAGLADELSRRDFTFNAMAVSLEDGSLLDPHGGRKDLAAGILRQVSPASFTHDPLRALRAVRFLAEATAARLDSRTGESLRRGTAGLGSCAAERILAEMDLLAATPRFGAALETMRGLGLLEVLAPEAAGMAGVTQNRFHHLDCWQHTVAAVNLADDPAALGAPLEGNGLPEMAATTGEDLLVLKYALLFHDLGKPDTRSIDEVGAVHFYGHERVSVHKAGKIARRWIFPHRRLHRVVALVRNHLRPGALENVAGERALRRLVHAAGADLELLLLHSLADMGATRGDDLNRRRTRMVGTCRKLRELFIHLGRELTRPHPYLDGHEVMEILGLSPGPELGAVLEELLLMQVEGRVSDREEALAAARKIARRRTGDSSN
jgi:tRNA nucleotidyltransferase/poly(A) polymerase